MLEPAELVEVLASHAGEEFASSDHWLSSAILATSAVGQPLGALVHESLEMTDLQSTVVTPENQLCLWREVVWYYLVGRRREVLSAFKAGIQGADAEAPHPILSQLRTLSFVERQVSRRATV